MRRIGGILFLGLLAACEPDTGETIVESAPTTIVETTTTSSTSTSTSTSTTAPTTSTSTTVARPTTTVAPVKVTIATTVPVTRPAPARSTTTPVPAGSCDPNYAGACVPIASDVDCGGGSGNGPAYVYAKNIRVVGTDIYDLDRDGDGIGCES